MLNSKKKVSVPAQFDLDLAVRQPWREKEIDRESFRQAVGTCLIFLHPPLFTNQFKGRGQLSLKDHKSNGVSSMEISQSYPLSLTQGAMTSSNVLIHHSLRIGPNRPRDLINPEAHKLVVGFTSHEAGARRNLFENDHGIKFRNGHARIDGSDALGQTLFIFSGKRPDRVINLQRHVLAPLMSLLPELRASRDQEGHGSAH